MDETRVPLTLSTIETVVSGDDLFGFTEEEIRRASKSISMRVDAEIERLISISVSHEAAPFFTDLRAFVKPDIDFKFHTKEDVFKPDILFGLRTVAPISISGTWDSPAPLMFHADAFAMTMSSIDVGHVIDLFEDRVHYRLRVIRKEGCTLTVRREPLGLLAWMSDAWSNLRDAVLDFIDDARADWQDYRDFMLAGLVERTRPRCSFDVLVGYGVPIMKESIRVVGCDA